MALADEQVIAYLVAKVGDVDPATGDPVRGASGILAQQLPTAWDLHADKAPALRRLYVQVEGIDLVLGVLRDAVSYQEQASGLQEALSDRMNGLLKQRAQVEARLTLVVRQQSGGGASLAGDLVHVTPRTPPTGWPYDANDPGFAGDPYFRGFGRGR